MHRAAAMALLLVACGAAPIRSEPPSVQAAPRWAPRIVRQDRSHTYVISDVEVAGVGRRVVRTGSGYVEVVDPATGLVWDAERIPRLVAIEIDPTLEQLCVVSGEAATPTIGVFDLASRTWLWSHAIGASGLAVRTIATSELCVAELRTDADRLFAFDRRTGEPRAIDASPIELTGDGPRRVLWSHDLLRRYDEVLGSSGTTTGWYVELRTGALAGPQPFWASCIELTNEGERIGLSPVESAERRAGLMPLIAAEWIECAVPVRERSPSQPLPLAAPWIPLADGRVVHHGPDGLYLFDWAAHRSPQRLSTEPPLSYVDVNQAQRWIEPVVGDTWIGRVDGAGALERYDATSGGVLGALALPPGSTDAATARWQVFAGAGERLFVIRDTDHQRHAWFTGDEGYVRTGAHVFGEIWQHAVWGGVGWRLEDSHLGIHWLDDHGAVRASFAPPEADSRISRAAPSPDGTRLAVVVGSWPTDHAEGVYVLDARDLAVLAHHEGDRSLYVDRDAIAWDARGIVIASGFGGPSAEPVWVVVDPESGSRTTLGVGSLRASWRYHRAGETHVWPTIDEDALVAGTAIDAERAVVSIVDGAGAVETPDGHVWCEGAACTRYRCIVDERTSAPIDDARCADLR
jgi:hypothetical protein